MYVLEYREYHYVCNGFDWFILARVLSYCTAVITEVDATYNIAFCGLFL